MDGYGNSEWADFFGDRLGRVLECHTSTTRTSAVGREIYRACPVGIKATPPIKFDVPYCWAVHTCEMILVGYYVESFEPTIACSHRIRATKIGRRIGCTADGGSYFMRAMWSRVCRPLNSVSEADVEGVFRSRNLMGTSVDTQPGRAASPVILHDSRGHRPAQHLDRASDRSTPSTSVDTTNNSMGSYGRDDSNLILPTSSTANQSPKAEDGIATPRRWPWSRAQIRSYLSEEVDVESAALPLSAYCFMTVSTSKGYGVNIRINWLAIDMWRSPHWYRAM
jgi:hypothetical protein